VKREEEGGGKEEARKRGGKKGRTEVRGRGERGVIVAMVVGLCEGRKGGVGGREGV